MAIEVVPAKHECGNQILFKVTDHDFLVADSYADQYSLNWTTRRSAFQWLTIWSHIAEKARAVIVSSQQSEPYEVYGYELFQAVRDNALQESEVLLLRLWLDDASVAWQRLPYVSSEPTRSGNSWSPIAGIASANYDYTNIRRYLSWSASEALSYDVTDGILHQLQEQLGHMPNFYLSLGSVNFEAKD